LKKKNRTEGFERDGGGMEMQRWQLVRVVDRSTGRGDHRVESTTRKGGGHKKVTGLNKILGVLRNSLQSLVIKNRLKKKGTGKKPGRKE